MNDIMESKLNSLAPLSIFFLLSEAELLEGDHVHPAWRGQVANAEAERAKPMIVKWQDGNFAISVELACALAAQCFKLPVPKPGIVLAPKEYLPGLPISVEGDLILLTGSDYKIPESFFTQAASRNPAAEEFVWSKLCSSDTGSSGAAWDELIANKDRHHQNALFDGVNWWLFDHDQALMSAGPFCKSPLDAGLRLGIIEFNAKCNLLADQMIARRRCDHGILGQAAKFSHLKTGLSLLVAAAKNWIHPDPKIQEIFDCTAILLMAIELRLPPLAEHIQARIAQPDSATLWS